MKLTALLEAFDPFYTVRRTSIDAFEVAKFSDRKEPERVDRVTKGPSGFKSSSPGFFRAGQQDKAILIVKRFLEDGEPELAYYTVDDARRISTHRFSEARGKG